MLEIETVPAAAALVSNAPLFCKKIHTHSLCVVLCFPKEKLNPPQRFHKWKMKGLRAAIERDRRRHLAKHASARLSSPHPWNLSQLATCHNMAIRGNLRGKALVLMGPASLGNEGIGVQGQKPGVSVALQPAGAAEPAGAHPSSTPPGAACS